MEKPIDFWLRKGKAVGETKPTETYTTIGLQTGNICAMDALPISEQAKAE